MALTAEALYQSSQLQPDDLGEEIVNFDDTPEAQRQAAIGWIAANVLPIADAEVSVPLLETTGYDTVAGFINGRFLSVDALTRAGWIIKGDALYVGAAISYGRSEINKSIDSNDESYDRDSDQDRIQGNQRLQKLLNWAIALMKTNAQGTGESTPASTANRQATTSVATIPVW